jgi:hypothetical protein
MSSTEWLNISELPRMPRMARSQCFTCGFGRFGARARGHLGLAF